MVELATGDINSVGHGGPTSRNPEFVNNAETKLNNDLHWTIDFVHVATGKCANFIGMVTEFSDNFTANWNSESVYGRMDPIQIFQNTQRQISLSWVVVATSAAMAEKNLHKFEHLSAMLYPTYSSEHGVSTMASGPLMKIKFTNLIQDSQAPVGKSALEGGLLGTVNGFTLTPNLDMGFFSGGAGKLYPKEYTVSTQITVLHTHELGWKESGGWRHADGKGIYGIHKLTGPWSTCPTKNAMVPAPTKAKNTKVNKAQQDGALATSADASEGGSSSNPVKAPPPPPKKPELTAAEKKAAKRKKLLERAAAAERKAAMFRDMGTETNLMDAENQLAKARMFRESAAAL